jgi:hypothetical protein
MALVKKLSIASEKKVNFDLKIILRLRRLSFLRGTNKKSAKSSSLRPDRLTPIKKLKFKLQ